MDWIIAVSKSERVSGCLSPETAEAARRALGVHGVTLLRGVFSQNTIDGLSEEFLRQFGDLDAAGMKARALDAAPNPILKVGSKRYDLTPRIDGAFADTAVFANPLLLKFLSGWLCEDVRLAGLTIVVSFPGADIQHIHRDHAHLYPESKLDTVLPPYAINVSVPMVDVDLETGPTGIWLGSHRWPEIRDHSTGVMTTIPFQRGDCILLDYRTLHTGLPNQSQRMRPVLYLAYSRAWFFDERNYKKRSSLNISMETYLGLPESAQQLLFRAYSQTIRAEQSVGGATPWAGAREGVG